MRKKNAKCASWKDRLFRTIGRLNSRGEGNTGCIFLLVIVAAAGFVGYKVAVPYFEYTNFESRVAEMMPNYRNHDAEYIQESVINISRGFDLDLKPEQVKVQVLKKDNRLIDFGYDQPVTVPFYTHTLKLKSHLTGTVF